MAVWAYQCDACRDSEATYFVARETVNEFPPEVTIVQVKVGKRWLCATVDRTRPVQIEGLLLRDVAATDAVDCAGCEDG